MKLKGAILVAGAALLIHACATSNPPPAGALFLGQISYVATPQEASHGFYYTAKADEEIFGVVPESADIPAAKSLMASCGYAQNPAASFALVRFYYYWFEASRGIANFSRWAMVDSNVSVERGNIVQVELRPGPSNSRCAVVNKVRAISLDEAECEYRDNKRGGVFSALAHLDSGGGPGSASFYCPFVKAEGWRATPLGPAAGSMGGIAWSKAPAD